MWRKHNKVFYSRAFRLFLKGADGKELSQGTPGRSKGDGQRHLQHRSGYNVLSRHATWAWVCAALHESRGLNGAQPPLMGPFPQR